MAKPEKTSAPTAILEWVGPPGQESPLFGELVAGQRYQTTPEMAAYLSAMHPGHWHTPVTAAKE